MPDRHATAGRRDDPWAWTIAFACALLLLRIAAASFGAFSEGDEISIAAGVAALQRGVEGAAYRYGVQVGYYNLVAGLTTLLGGRLLSIPDIMVTLSVVGGTVIPLAGLRSFRDTLTRSERWMLAALLVANPIIWQAARYGNTAIVSVALVASAVAVLSNAPRVRGESLAMALFAGAIFVRADAVLLSGVIFVLLWSHHRRVVRAAIPLVLCGAVVGATFALLLLRDPRMGEVVQSVASHTANPITTKFAEFLLFGMSPIPLLMAAAGARDLQRERPLLLATLAVWIVPVGAFYFPSTTTPRYLMQLMPPLCLAAAVGVCGSFAARGPARLASRALVLLLVFVHLLVGLSAFSPARTRSWLTAASLPSDDGPAWTGALLYKTFVLRPPARGPVWRPRRFAAANEVERSLEQMFDTLRAGQRAGRRIVIITKPGYENEMHFFAHVAGVDVVRRDSVPAFARPIQLAMGGAAIDAVGIRYLEDSRTMMPVRSGDEVWALHLSRTEADAALQSLTPTNVALRPLPDWPRAKRLWRYSVESR